MASAAEVTQGAPDRLERAKRLIRGMLERTEERGFTEAEALEAAAKVGAMLKQYDLELTDVIVRDVSDMVQRELYAADDAAGGLVTGIGKLCSLQTYHKTGTGGTYVVFGHAPDVELALYLWEVCAHAAEDGWSKHMAKHGYSKRKRDDYRAGFGSMMYARMSELRAERDAAAQARATASGCTSLVVIKDQIVKAEFEKTGVRLRTRPGRKVKHHGAYVAGADHARTVNISNPLGHGSANARLVE